MFLLFAVSEFLTTAVTIYTSFFSSIRPKRRLAYERVIPRDNAIPVCVSSSGALYLISELICLNLYR